MAPGADGRHCLRPEHETYCLRRCNVLDTWLNMGTGIQYGPSRELIEEYSQIGLWRLCPMTLFSVAMEIGRSQILSLPAAWQAMEDGILAAVEQDVADLFFVHGLNITKYYHPRTTSASLFFHLQKVVEAIESRRGRGAGADPSGGVELLRKAVDDDAEFPRRLGSDVGHADGSRSLWAMSNDCSLTSLAFGLADALEDYHRVEAAVLEGTPGAAGEAPMRLNKRFNIAQRCLMRLVREGGFVRRVLAEGSPLLGILDRLDCRTYVLVQREVESDHVRLPSGEGFLMHVLPIRDFESNFVRSYSRFHCDMGYKDLLLRRHAVAASSGRRFAVAEVGAYLGGCSFWALVHLPGIRVVAVEQHAPAVEAMFRSAASNGFSEDDFRAVEACVADAGTHFEPTFRRFADLRQPGMTKGDSSSGRRPCRTFGEVLAPLPEPSGYWDMVRLHTSGNDISILRSGLPMLREGRVRALVVMLQGPGCNEDCRGIAAILFDLGAELMLLGEVVRELAAFDRMPDGAPTPLLADFSEV